MSSTMYSENLTSLVTEDTVSNDLSTTSAYPICKQELLAIVVEIVTWMMTIYQLYLIVVLTYYACIVASFKTARVRTGEEQYSSRFSQLLLLSAIVVFLRIFLNVDTVWESTGIQYTILKILKYIGTAGSLTLIYSILWLRQKILYTHRLTEHLSTNFTRILVWGVFVLLIIACVMNAIFFIYPDTYVSSPYECLFHDRQTSYATMKWIVLMVSMGFFQVLLLSLFVYPLVKQAKIMDSKQAKVNNLYKTIIKRVILSTCICILSDAAATMTTLIMKSVISHDTTDFLFDLTLFINELSVIYSFGDWKARMFPMLPSSRQLRHKNRHISFYQSKPAISGTGASKASSN